MSVISCIVQCKCGGIMTHTVHDGTWYHLTDNHYIVFHGICSICGKEVKVEKELTTLIMMCPNKKGVQ